MVGYPSLLGGSSRQTGGAPCAATPAPFTPYRPGIEAFDQPLGGVGTRGDVGAFSPPTLPHR